MHKSYGPEPALGSIAYLCDLEYPHRSAYQFSNGFLPRNEKRVRIAERFDRSGSIPRPMIDQCVDITMNHLLLEVIWLPMPGGG